MLLDMLELPFWVEKGAASRPLGAVAMGVPRKGDAQCHTDVPEIRDFRQTTAGKIRLPGKICWAIAADPADFSREAQTALLMRAPRVGAAALDAAENCRSTYFGGI
jgi:hypothetical protein